MLRLGTLLNSLMSTVTRIEYCATFVGASQLYCSISDLLPSTLWAWLLNYCRILHITSFHGLNRRSLLSQQRGEWGGFGFRLDDLWRSIYSGVSIEMRGEGLHKPLFSAPQQSQTRIVFLFPVELSNRLPQSVQKTRDPIADIWAVVEACEASKKIPSKLKFEALYRVHVITVSANFARLQLADCLRHSKQAATLPTFLQLSRPRRIGVDWS